jgi:L-ascorbate metabolism protein UlaG (beta-lactamase superfamily)
MADRVRWLGHSTVLIELDGVRALTDPLLRKQVLHLRRAVPLEVDEASEADVVLLSHLHYDHVDLPSLRKLDRTIPLVVPRGAGALVSRQGFRSVVELTAGEETAVGKVTVRAVPAEHASSRIVGKKAEALGYVVAGSREVYFAGDTDLFPGLAELADGLDVALLPIWGWGPSLGPADVEAPLAAGVPQRPGRGVRAAGRRARARGRRPRAPRRGHARAHGKRCLNMRYAMPPAGIGSQ